MYQYRSVVGIGRPAISAASSGASPEDSQHGFGVVALGARTELAVEHPAHDHHEAAGGIGERGGGVGHREPSCGDPAADVASRAVAERAGEQSV